MIILWETNSNKPIHILNEHKSCVYSVSIGANDKYHYYPINSMEWTQILIPNANSESLQFASHQFLFELQ